MLFGFFWMFNIYLLHSNVLSGKMQTGGVEKVVGKTFDASVLYSPANVLLEVFIL